MTTSARLLLEQQFPRSVAALPDLFSAVRSALETLKPKPDHLRNIEFGIEEVFTNMVKYNSKSSSAVTLRLTLEGAGVRTDLVDPDSDEFDPWNRPMPDVEAPLEKRRPGGLGIHLVKTMLTDVRYDYHGRESTVSFIQDLS